MDAIRYIISRNFQHCVDDLVYESAYLREYNIKLQTAMQRASFIKSFHPAFATMLYEDAAFQGYTSFNTLLN